MRDFGTAPFRTAVLSEWGRVIAFLSAWFDSTVSHQMAHGLIPHKAARLTSRATKESFESLKVWVDFPTGCASNNSPGGEPELFYMPPERSLERGACLDTAGSIPRAAFHIPVVQVMERRSPKPQDAGLSPAGNARLCMTGGRHAENSGASGRESSRCSGFVYDRQSCLLYAAIAQLGERRPFKAGQRW